MEEDDMVKSMAIALYGDEPIRREGGLQARVYYGTIIDLVRGSLEPWRYVYRRVLSSTFF
jgi:hypothetical protein